MRSGRSRSASRSASSPSSTAVTSKPSAWRFIRTIARIPASSSANSTRRPPRRTAGGRESGARAMSVQRPGRARRLTAGRRREARETNITSPGDPDRAGPAVVGVRRRLVLVAARVSSRSLRRSVPVVATSSTPTGAAGSTRPRPVADVAAVTWLVQFATGLDSPVALAWRPATRGVRRRADRHRGDRLGRPRRVDRARRLGEHHARQRAGPARPDVLTRREEAVRLLHRHQRQTRTSSSTR